MKKEKLERMINQALLSVPRFEKLRKDGKKKIAEVVGSYLRILEKGYKPNK